MAELSDQQTSVLATNVIVPYTTDSVKISSAAVFDLAASSFNIRGKTISNTTLTTEQIATFHWTDNTALRNFVVDYAQPIKITFDGRNIWFVGANNSAGETRLYHVDPISGSQVTPYITLFANTTDIPTRPCYDGQDLWIGLSTGSLLKLSSNSGEITGTYNFFSEPIVDICSDNGLGIWLLVTTPGSKSILKRFDKEVSVSQGAIINEVIVGNDASAMCYDGQYIWVVNSADNTVSKVSIEPNWAAHVGGYKYPVNRNWGGPTIVATYSVGNTPNKIVYDGEKIWTANYGDHTLSTITISTGKVTTYSNVTPLDPLFPYDEGSNGPCTLCFDGYYIWVINYSTVQKRIASSGIVASTFSIRSSSKAKDLCFDGSNMWLALESSTRLYKI